MKDRIKEIQEAFNDLEEYLHSEETSLGKFNELWGKLKQVINGNVQS